MPRCGGEACQPHPAESVAPRALRDEPLPFKKVQPRGLTY